jgi:hypothetical protein
LPNLVTLVAQPGTGWNVSIIIGIVGKPRQSAAARFAHGRIPQLIN